MKRLLSRYEKTDFGLFFLFALVSGLCLSERVGILPSTVFGLAVAAGLLEIQLFMRGPRPERVATIVVSIQKPVIYILLFAFHFCVSVIILSCLAHPDWRYLVVLPCLAGAALFFYLSYSMSVQYVFIGPYLMVRRSFLHFKFEKIFSLSELQSSELHWYSGLVLKFRSGETFAIFSHDPKELDFLPRAQKEPLNPNLVLLARLREEIKVRSKIPAAVSQSIRALFPLEPFRPVGWTGFVISGLVCFAAMSAVAYGEEILHKKAKYFCSESSPTDCYFIYKHPATNASEMEAASSVLKKICRQSEHKDKICCSCHKDLN